MALRKFALLAVVGVAALACGGTSSSGPSTGSTITLGAPLGLTGSLTKESQLTQQGYDLWKEGINARGGIVVSFAKMRRIHEIDRPNLQAVVEPGLVFADLQLALQVLDPLAERGLSQVKGQRSAAEVKMLRHLDESPQLTELHR